MSTKLWWLATTTYGRRGSSIIVPLVWKRHSGLSAWWATVNLRNM